MLGRASGTSVKPSSPVRSSSAFALTSRIYATVS